MTCHGSIPACAGEPPYRIFPFRRIPVYPRVCGGTHSRFHPSLSKAGLSPRVRGNRLRRRRRYRRLGSIPACAGEPRTGLRGRRTRRVYPRVCGGTAHHPVHPYQLRGLSPRVRGNRIRRRPLRGTRRSIPACAGEPRVRQASASRPKVYPRVCGGTYIFYGTGGRIQGLSPRVRGNLYILWDRGKNSGSIPACAGEPPP